MARLIIKLDSAEFDEVRRVLDARLQDARPVLRAVGMQLMRSVDLQFRAEGARFGAKWKPSRRALKQRGQTLHDTGRLSESIVSGGVGAGSIYRLSESSLEIGSNLAYAAIHQFGGTIRQAARSDRLPRTFARLGHRLVFQGRDGKVTVGHKLDGTPIKRKLPTVASTRLTFNKERTIQMPARPYLPEELTEEDRSIIQRELERYLNGGKP